ncbi:substrate-binding domain-containing protein [Sphingosinicella sp.]|uniref:substrate-binding domain-containing protein n=1 Tax=Sphingosinicella sp. TaxID=1917971 RepID=UPI004037A9FC
MKKRLFVLAGLVALLGACGQSATSGEADRGHILIAGSSTVYPFTQAVAERFKAGNAGQPAPVVQSTGTGAGFEQFCGGIGGSHPDVVGASRRIHPEELERCRANGVANVTELQIGMDGVVVVQSPAAPQQFNLTRVELYTALAAQPFGQPNQRRRWNEVNPSLPDLPIMVYGLPASSGTRESLGELIMIGGCQSDERMRALRQQNEAQFHQACTAIRTDGAYVESGEDDERTATGLIVNPGAIGIFGYNFLQREGERLRGIPVDGTAPSAETITSGRYPGARPLYLYVKSDQVERVPGLRALLNEYMSAIVANGYLAQRGLIPLPEEQRQRTVESATRLRPLTATMLR